MVQYVVQPSCVKFAWLTLGASNCTRWGLDENVDEVLLRVGNREWKTKYIYREGPNGKMRRCLRKCGFKRFLTENDVEVGDIMIFEKVNTVMGIPVFEVKINHSSAVVEGSVVSNAVVEGSAMKSPSVESIADCGPSENLPVTATGPDVESTSIESLATVFGSYFTSSSSVDLSWETFFESQDRLLP